MRNVCFIDLGPNDDLSVLKEIISSLNEKIVMLNILNGTSSEMVTEVLEVIKSNNKKIFLVARSKDFIDKADYVIIYERIPELKEIVNLLSKGRKYFVYKMFDPTKKDLKEYSDLVRLSGINRFFTLVTSKEQSLHNLRKVCSPYEESLNIIYLDIPVCSAEQKGVRTTYRNFLDISKVIYDSKFCEEETLAYHASEFVKFSKCRNCVENNKCFGFLKTVSHKEPVPLNNSSNKLDSIFGYLSKTERRILARSYSYSGKSVPESEEDVFCQKEIKILQNCRKGDLGNFDFYHIWTVDQSMFFNRHIEQVPLFNHDPRGLDSIDMTFIGAGVPELAHKLKQDLVLPKHGFMILSKVFFANQWSEEDMKALDNFTMTTLKQIVIDHGGDPTLIEQQGNDLMYNGKKFCGKEWKFLPPYGYIENTVVTTEYLPEKKWFDQLYHYPGEKTITGITEEVRNCTKEVLMNELVSRFNRRFNAC